MRGRLPGWISGEAARRIALLLAAVALSLALGEAAVRIYDATLACQGVRPDPPGMLTRVPGYEYVLTPGYRGTLGDRCWETNVSISASGTRGRGAEGDRGGDRRILFLGDSYAFGYGLEEEDAIPSRLERHLNEAAGGAARVEVINAGVPGWTTLQHSLFVEEKAGTFGTDEIVMLIYLGNDIEERVRVEERADRARGGAGGAGQTDAGVGGAGDGLAAEGEAGRRDGAGGGILSRSRLAHTLRYRLREAAYGAGLCRRPAPEEWFEIFRIQEPPRVARGLALVRKDFERMGRFCSANGIGLRAVLAPAWVQITRPTSGDLCGAFECKEDEMDLKKPNVDIAAALEGSRIPHLDLTEELTRAYLEKRFRFTAGGHWDREGCDLAAARIAGWLSQGATIGRHPGPPPSVRTASGSPASSPR